MTGEIGEEWDRHQSRFARRWRVSMVARKRIEMVEVPSDRTLEKRVARAVADEYLAPIVDKDRRLIEAALVTENRVSSLDDHVRKHLRDHLSRLPEILAILWFNPCTPEEKAVEWLKAGAPDEPARRLGFVPKPPRRRSRT